MLTAKRLENWIHVPPVFIVGCFRSGTSLLRLMLSAHSKVWISGEGAYVYKLRDRYRNSDDLLDPDRLEQLHKYIVPFLEDEKWIGIPAFEELYSWTQRNGSTFRSLITFYNTWDARLVGKEELIWWGDNAPYHVYNVPYFDHTFPGSRYIQIIRDPRDIFTSIKFNYKETYTLNSVMDAWYNSVYYGILSERFLGPARFLTLHYESLVTEPEKTLKQVCEFLEISFEPSMLSYHESKASAALAQHSQHRNVLKPVFASSVGKFREMLSKEEIDQITQRFATHLRCLGYLSDEEHMEALDLPK